ncbi:gamma-glutamyltransferase family protein [Actinoplanes rectilineatus]|uniref:gamma-glutamyltransferase family protein n=1 Tax=Actinoplanes rectilineatus TaxID=113571 RepID=UPI0009F8EB04|nr:gamma-glutamyltransferase [Actinoplanes rectilineatus]
MNREEHLASGGSTWLHTKTEARSRHGMVCARHPLAAAAGCQILRQGGNAVDAAAAASFANGVVQPFANSLGGGGLLVMSGFGDQPRYIDYRYEAPSNSTPDMFTVRSQTLQDPMGWRGVANRENEVGYRAVGVPGSAAGLVAAVEQFGSLALSDVMAPAIELAASGFETDWLGALMQGIHLDELCRFPATAHSMLRDGRFPYRPATVNPADVQRQPLLAETMRGIAEAGASFFYAGGLAQQMSADIMGHGGILDAADLAAYRPRQGTARRTPYRRFEILGADNVSVAPFLFGVLARLDLAGRDPLDPRRIHLILEAIKRCRTIERRHLGDTLFMDGTWPQLCTPERMDEIADSISPDRASPLTDLDEAGVAGGHPGKQPVEGTTHICATDADGNVVSLTETVLSSYGSRVVTAGGVLLNNAMFAFSPHPGKPNSIAPGKRPLSNMTPIIVSDRSGGPFLCLGATGGQRISTAVAQILSLVVDAGYGIQDAISTPRFDVSVDDVILDSRMPRHVVTDLERRGHSIVLRSEEFTTLHFANACGILRSSDGEYTSGVNPLSMTAAAAY